MKNLNKRNKKRLVQVRKNAVIYTIIVVLLQTINNIKQLKIVVKSNFSLATPSTRLV